MKKYRTTEVVGIASGVIELNGRQAVRRPGKLKPMKKKGLYEILAPIEFKQGEVIGLENPDKVLLSKLDELDKDGKPVKGAAVAAEKITMERLQEQAPALVKQIYDEGFAAGQEALISELDNGEDSPVKDKAGSEGEKGAADGQGKGEKAK